MAEMRVVMDPNWLAHVREAEQVFLDERLGPDIVADAKRYCPVDTGRLEASIDHQVLSGGGDAPELQVASFPDDDGPVEYAMAVEFGYHGLEVVHEHTAHSSRGREFVVREHVRHANQPAEPYLRPAVYQERYQ